MIDSSLALKAPRRVRSELRKGGLQFDGDGHMKKKVLNFVRSVRHKACVVDMPLEKQSRCFPLSVPLSVENVIFNAHTVYTCTLGAATVVPEEGRLTVALSSENLLLNAYRQTRFGFSSYLCVDTTHRLIKVHMCLLPTNCFSKVLCACAFTYRAGRPQQHVGGNGRLEPAVPHRGVCHLLSRRRACARGGVPKASMSPRLLESGASPAWTAPSAAATAAPPGPLSSFAFAAFFRSGES